MTAIRSGSVWLAVVVVLLLHQHQPATATGGDGKRVFGARTPSKKSTRTAERTIRTEAGSVGAPVSASGGDGNQSATGSGGGKQVFGAHRRSKNTGSKPRTAIEQQSTTSTSQRVWPQHSDDSAFVHSTLNVTQGPTYKNVNLVVASAVTFTVRQGYNYNVSTNSGAYYKLGHNSDGKDVITSRDVKIYNCGDTERVTLM
eukprot:Lankesteria_metandrocarpae@DN5353_c1_g1_i9.p1